MKINNISSTGFGLKPNHIKIQNKVIDFVRDENDKVLSYSVKDNNNRLLKEYSKTEKDGLTSIVIDEYQYIHDFASVKDIRKIEIARSNDKKIVSVKNKSLKSGTQTTDIYFNEFDTFEKAQVSFPNPDNNFTLKSIKGKMVKIFGNY